MQNFAGKTDRLRFPDYLTRRILAQKSFQIRIVSDILWPALTPMQRTSTIRARLAVNFDLNAATLSAGFPFGRDCSGGERYRSPHQAPPDRRCDRRLYPLHDQQPPREAAPVLDPHDGKLRPKHASIHLFERQRTTMPRPNRRRLKGTHESFWLSNENCRGHPQRQFPQSVAGFLQLR